MKYARQAFVTARDLFKLAERFKAGADDSYSLLASETVMLLSGLIRKPSFQRIKISLFRG